jgi:hypothetical protein
MFRKFWDGRFRLTGGFERLQNTGKASESFTGYMIPSAMGGELRAALPVFMNCTKRRLE